jgi:acetylornithine deacetylase
MRSEGTLSTADPLAPSPHAGTGALEEQFANWFAGCRGALVGELAELVSLVTTSPYEQRAFPWLRTRMEALGAHVSEEPRHSSLPNHPAANHNAYLAMPAEERSNLHAQLPAVAAPVRTLFSAHVDVIPAGARFEHAFEPEVLDDALVGRGAADTKGNVVMLLAALRFIADAKLTRTRDVAVDFVVEEETGGNGALSAALHGRAADEVVVLEPTGLEVFHGHRGCLEFTLDVAGRSTHMGAGTGLSAIDGAIAFIEELRALEVRLIAEARTDSAFATWECPLQINVGAIEGGEWHGSIPERCLVRGAFGFLPRYCIADVERMLALAVEALPTAWFREQSTLRYEGVHNGAYLSDPNAQLTRDLRSAAQAAGAPSRPGRAWNVSCDARLYSDLLGVPTVIFGAGSLLEAHSSHERLEFEEWARGILTLARFLTSKESEWAQ